MNATQWHKQLSVSGRGERYLLSVLSPHSCLPLLDLHQAVQLSVRGRDGWREVRA